MSGALGLLHLGDLQVSYPWSRPRLPGILAALGWSSEGGEGEVRRDPPPRLAVVVPMHLVAALDWHRAWLRQARSILVIREIAEPEDQEVRDDAELREVVGESYAAAEARLGRPVEAIWWTGSAASTAALRGRLEALAARAPVDAGRAMTLPRPDVAPPAAPPGPWRAWETEPLGGLGALARTICVDAGRPAILEIGRDSLALRSLESGAILRSGSPLQRVAISGDGRRVLGRAPAGALVEYGPLEGPRRSVAGIDHATPFYLAPALGLGAAGSRCWFRWLRVDDDDASVLAPVVHEWPCGHGKKLWGYMDNEPVLAEVSAAADAYLSVYDVDAIVGSVVEPRWRAAGPLQVPVWPPHDPLRALFTCPDWRYLDGRAPAAGLADEDCRGDAPAIALGPDAEHRYALGLDREVWRLRGEEAVQLGAGGEGYAIYSADHRLCRRGRGRLLCGGAGWLWIEAEGAIWREPIRGGERVRCVDVDRRIDAALALPGAANAVLIHVVAPPEPAESEDHEARRVPWFHERFELRLV